MGLLDLLKSKDPMVANGLLQMGLSLLSSKGNFGSALGNAGMAGLQGATRFKERKLWEQMQQAQLDQAQRLKAMQGREDTLANLPGQYIVPPSQPGVDATGGMETALEAPQNQSSPMGRMDLPGLAQAFMRTPGGLNTGLTLSQSLQKQAPQPLKLGANDRLLDPATYRELVPALPGGTDKSPLEKAMALRDSFPAGHPNRQIAERQIEKLVSHPQGVSVSYGAPVAGVDPSGSPVFFQPSKAGGQASIIPGVRPPNDKKTDLTEAQAKATAFLGQMRSASKSLEAIGADQTALSIQAETALAGGPMNVTVRQKAQRIRQAQEQWSEAFLRFKTGAASTKDEVAANLKTFFPTFGDGPEVVAQKKAARAQAEADMAVAAGRGTGQLNARDAAGTDQSDPLGLRR